MQYLITLINKPAIELSLYDKIILNAFGFFFVLILFVLVLVVWVIIDNKWGK